RGRRNARALGAVHPCADPSRHRRPRRPAHASDVGDRAQHAGRQPAGAGQTAAFFHGQIAYDDDYTGLAATLAEGERLAALMGKKPIVFMKNHGVLVTGDTVAQAYRRLYRIERVCRYQILALSSGRPLQVLSDEVAARVQAPNPEDRHPRGERERLFFEAMMRVLDREMPGYRD